MLSSIELFVCWLCYFVQMCVMDFSKQIPLSREDIRMTVKLCWCTHTSDLLNNPYIHTQGSNCCHVETVLFFCIQSRFCFLCIPHKPCLSFLHFDMLFLKYFFLSIMAWSASLPLSARKLAKSVMWLKLDPARAWEAIKWPTHTLRTNVSSLQTLM